MLSVLSDTELFFHIAPIHLFDIVKNDTLLSMVCIHLLGACYVVLVPNVHYYPSMIHSSSLYSSKINTPTGTVVFL